MNLTDELVAFLLARFAEDEAVARDAVIPAHDAPNAYKPHGELASWRYRPGDEVEYDYDDPHQYPDRYYVTCDGEGLTPAVDEAVGPHIARHDPARVLAVCEAHRRIVLNADAAVRLSADKPDDGPEAGVALGLMAACAALALPYADHEDFQEEWRV